MTDDISTQAQRFRQLWDRLRDELGDELFGDADDAGFEYTPKGRYVVHVDDRSYWENDGRLMVGRMRGGHVEFGEVVDGEVLFRGAGAIDPDSN